MFFDSLKNAAQRAAFLHRKEPVQLKKLNIPVCKGCSPPRERRLVLSDRHIVLICTGMSVYRISCTCISAGSVNGALLWAANVPGAPQADTAISLSQTSHFVLLMHPMEYLDKHQLLSRSFSLSESRNNL